MSRGVGVSNFICAIHYYHALLPVALELLALLLTFSSRSSFAGFYINLPLGGAFAVLLLLSHIPEATKKLPPSQVFGTAIKSLDLPGFMLVSPASIMLLVGLQYGGTLYPWNSSVVIGLIVGGIVTFALFLLWENHQGDGAMIPIAMLKQKTIWSAAGTIFFLLGAILAAEYYLAIYFQAVQGNTPLMSGVHILPTTLGLVTFTILSGTMSMFSPPRPALAEPSPLSLSSCTW